MGAWGEYRPGAGRQSPHAAPLSEDGLPHPQQVRGERLGDHIPLQREGGGTGSTGAVGGMGGEAGCGLRRKWASRLGPLVRHEGSERGRVADRNDLEQCPLAGRPRSEPHELTPHLNQPHRLVGQRSRSARLNPAALPHCVPCLPFRHSRGYGCGSIRVILRVESGVGENQFDGLLLGQLAAISATG